MVRKKSNRVAKEKIKNSRKNHKSLFNLLFVLLISLSLIVVGRIFDIGIILWIGFIIFMILALSVFIGFVVGLVGQIAKIFSKKSD